MERPKTKIYKEIQIDSHGKGSEAPQDTFHICWTILSSLSTRTQSEDATSFGKELFGELIVPWPSIYMHTIGARMGMDKALEVDFHQKIIM